MSAAGPRRLLPYGDRGLLVELSDVGEVLAWAAALRADAPASVGEVVAGGATVLVRAAAGAEVADLRCALEALDVADPTPANALGEPAEVVIEVRYDGEDLEEVGQLTGLGPDGVVEAHTAQVWRVAFGGFAPGFGYLVGENNRLRVPRREVSRTAVPAGAVALAEDYSGIYPRRSPGGWQLIGTTDTVTFDLDRDPPALLRPGACVRFVRAEGS